MPVYSLVKSILTQLGWYHSCLWPCNVKWHSLNYTMPVYVLTMSTDTVHLIPCNQHSLVNTKPAYGLTICLVIHFGQYHACLWPGEINIDIVWSIPCLFMVWWSQCWHSSVDTVPVYGLVKSILIQFGQYHACLWSGEVNVDTVWLIPCRFRAW